ncbi:PRKC apoptosis WT1 regulator protein-like isoform X2 [Tachypleus tridentatus]|uniref:PRKC apoptosis WT1 regulator protein-like isoform X2 n=1 Tax=Tachypleus tridentatus TaxID=6853 RepID=UPI003FD3722B
MFVDIWCTVFIILPALKRKKKQFRVFKTFFHIIMASSSLSQEDADHDFEISSRQSRIRTARANARNVPTSSKGTVAEISGAGDAEASVQVGPVYTSGIGTCGVVDSSGITSGIVDQDVSPKPTSRVKDKRCPRPNHVNKGKAQRERRKLREKRRSTGVVHLPSTESTGGSTGEDEDELLSMSAETKRNTSLNESSSKYRAEVAMESLHEPYRSRNNKSPSDLDADDEDNQDYDSTVNQSDSTVSLVQDDANRSVQKISTSVNGRPETPCSESSEELLERARKENHRLLEVVKEKDALILFLEQKVDSLSCELSATQLEKKRLEEKNHSLLTGLANLKVK